MYNINQKFRIIVSKHFDNIHFRINLCNLMITCMKFILLEGQQLEKVVSRCLTSSASSWIYTQFQVLRKTWNWLTRNKLSWNRFSPPFFSDSKKIDEFCHAKQVLLVNPISSLIVKRGVFIPLGDVRASSWVIYFIGGVTKATNSKSQKKNSVSGDVWNSISLILWIRSE